ncbi:CBS domain-containing protein [Streptomyces sp. NPDC002588]|uniref:CBS domain-containing protein n=1 Tax=Streptomyces sp. NPDC002588 TaxID=3154419 RepID=UPI00332C1049
MARIVGEVMTQDVVEAHRDTSLKEVVRLLDRHRISGVPVVDADDKVVGVISETDLIRRQAARSPDGRALTAQELMSSPAVTVHPEQRIADAARVMERHGVERLPVVDEEDRLIGIATRRDLLRIFLRTDDEITREVRDDVLGGARGVTVSVRDGVVTLAGSLAAGADLPLAIRLTYRVDGVLGVVNRLTVHTSSGPIGPAKGPTGPGTGPG